MAAARPADARVLLAHMRSGPAGQSTAPPPPRTRKPAPIWHDRRGGCGRPAQGRDRAVPHRRYVHGLTDRASASLTLGSERPILRPGGERGAMRIDGLNTPIGGTRFFSPDARGRLDARHVTVAYSRDLSRRCCQLERWNRGFAPIPNLILKGNDRRRHRSASSTSSGICRTQRAPSPISGI